MTLGSSFLFCFGSLEILFTLLLSWSKGIRIPGSKAPRNLTRYSAWRSAPSGTQGDFENLRIPTAILNQATSHHHCYCNHPGPPNNLPGHLENLVTFQAFLFGFQAAHVGLAKQRGFKQQRGLWDYSESFGDCAGIFSQSVSLWQEV